MAAISSTHSTRRMNRASLSSGERRFNAGSFRTRAASTHNARGGESSAGRDAGDAGGSAGEGGGEGGGGDDQARARASLRGVPQRPGGGDRTVRGTGEAA